MEELRCPAKMHARLDANVVEVKCTSRWCGAIPGVVVLHQFDTLTGRLIDTLRFRDPKGGVKT